MDLGSFNGGTVFGLFLAFIVLLAITLWMAHGESQDTTWDVEREP